MLYPWNNWNHRQLCSKRPVNDVTNAVHCSAVMDKFISLPQELHLQIVSMLSPDDLIRLVRILQAYAPSSQFCNAVGIFERPSNLRRRSLKPIYVIFITPSFRLDSHYDALVKQCEFPLNFVFMQGDDQTSHSLHWLTRFLTDDTIGQKTKIHVSGKVSELDFNDMAVKSAGLYSECLRFKKCDFSCAFALGGPAQDD